MNLTSVNKYLAYRPCPVLLCGGAPNYMCVRPGFPCGPGCLKLGVPNFSGPGLPGSAYANSQGETATAFVRRVRDGATGALQAVGDSGGSGGGVEVGRT
jgi:hypothetical protein